MFCLQNKMEVNWDKTQKHFDEGAADLKYQETF